MATLLRRLCHKAGQTTYPYDNGRLGFQVRCVPAILRDKGKVTAAIAKAFAESEFEQYRVIQDRLYQSDFDRLVASTEEK